MSFASDVKDEVARQQLPARLANARLSAVVQLLAAIDMTRQGMALTIRTANANVARASVRDLQACYGVEPQLAAVKKPRFDKTSSYVITVSGQARAILQDLDLWTESGLQEHPRQRFIDSDERVRAYLQGCFMATGSLNAPTTANYHLEMTATNPALAEFIVRQMARFRLTAKVTVRRGQPVVYLKASEQIADFLRLIGASQAVLAFEDERIQRDFMNNFSRLDNCELANEYKSMQAARKQVEAVDRLRKLGLLEAMEDKQRDIAMLRLQHPEATLLELSEAYEAATGTKLSKSGIRHRLLKLMEMAARHQ